MTQRFAGRVALVTGAATGIGRAGARLFAREGAKVLVSTGSNMAGVEETVRLIKEAGGEASFVQCDVSQETQVRALVETCVGCYGRLDYAFNNAGIGPDGVRVPVLNIIDTPEDIWDRTVDVNLKGVFLCLKYEMRQMIDQKYGAIVNTSSVGAVKPVPGFVAYTASKAGLNGITKTAALEGAAHNVRVNTIMPGPTQNTLLHEYLTGAEPGKRAEMESIIPLHRIADPEDMAEAVVWLCSDVASFITGQCLPIDGGMTAG
ncbi:MAG: glucose 1-dehydrogenase [Actinomycetia bacterium]|nr:glucose 1-dehydrogenase [Actinomycetes bacterium]